MLRSLIFISLVIPLWSFAQKDDAIELCRNRIKRLEDKIATYEQIQEQQLKELKELKEKYINYLPKEVLEERVEELEAQQKRVLKQKIELERSYSQKLYTIGKELLDNNHYQQAKQLFNLNMELYPYAYYSLLSKKALEKIPNETYPKKK